MAPAALELCWRRSITTCRRAEAARLSTTWTSLVVTRAGGLTPARELVGTGIRRV